MVFIRIVLIILMPVIALLFLAYTHIYTQKHYPRGIEQKSKEELARGHHQKTLVDYLQSRQSGEPPPAEHAGEEGEPERDSR